MKFNVACATPGCPELVPSGTRGGRCPAHTRANDRAYKGRRKREGTGRMPGWTASQIKAQVLREQSGRCEMCGTDQPPFILEHVVRLVDGGSNERANLVVLCEADAKRKSAAERRGEPIDLPRPTATLKAALQAARPVTESASLQRRRERREAAAPLFARGMSDADVAVELGISVGAASMVRDSLAKNPI